MTLLPVEQKRLGRAPEAKYEIRTFTCSNPQCNQRWVDKHHIVRRSYAGASDWVLIDGLVHPNLVGLCRPCHDLITTNKARIVFSDGEYQWVPPKAMFGERLTPYPDAMLGGDAVMATPAGLMRVDIEPVGPAASRCPSCDRPMPKEKPHKHEEKRERRTWSVTVPKDEREDGADVLDTLIEECRKVFGHDTSEKVRYFTVVQALALVVQNATKLVASD